MKREKKFNRIMISVLFIFLVSFSLALAQTNETLTITTYYPSPFGSYKELQTQILYFQENMAGQGLIGFNYPDATYDKRLRITAGKADTGIGGSLLGNDQGASVDLHGNNYGGGNSGMLDLVAGAGGDIRFWTSPAGIGALGRMYILDSGDVGIGTTTASGLQINTAVSETAQGVDNVRLGVAGTGRIIFEDAGSTQHEIDTLTGVMRFYRPGIVDMAIDANGNVGIGTTTPGAKLDVSGSINFTSPGSNLSGAGQTLNCAANEYVCGIDCPGGCDKANMKIKCCRFN